MHEASNLNRRLTDHELDDLIDFLESSHSEDNSSHTYKKVSRSESIAEGNHPLRSSPHSSIVEESDPMKRVGNSQLPGSPIPKPRTQKTSMSRSRSCDHLASDAVKEGKKVTESYRKTTLIPGSSTDEDITAKVPR